MRIRQVKPGFWTDSRIAALQPAARLFYIGLWMLADDAGWFRTEPAEIANELFGYESRKRRERDVERFLVDLTDAGRIEQYACGHGFIPTFKDHQRLAGETKQVVTIKREHASCPHVPATPRDSPLVPDPVRLGKELVSNGKERNGQSSRARSREAAARETDGESEFSQKVPRLIALGDT